MLKLFVMLLTIQAPAVARLSDEQVYGLGNRDFLLDSHARRALFDDPAFRERFRGNSFAPSCAAFFRAVRQQRGRYDARFRPILVGALRTIVGDPGLAGATGRPMFAGGPLIPYEGRVSAKVNTDAAALLAEAAQGLRAAYAVHRARTDAITGVSPIPWRADGGGSVQMACALWAGNNQAIVFANVGVPD